MPTLERAPRNDVIAASPGNVNEVLGRIEAIVGSGSRVVSHLRSRNPRADDTPVS